MEEGMAENQIAPPHPIHRPPPSSQLPLSPTSISSSVKIILDILIRTTPQQIEPALASTGIIPTTEVVVEVLKLSYDYPFSAIKFFRWAGLAHKHSAHAWNLMVDLLGRNRLFESMWDAIRSMRQEKTLSLAAFASAFGNYCASGSFDDALMTFQVMDKYGIPNDVVAANSLLSAMCRENGGVLRALDFLETMKSKPEFGPDGDSFAILLEGLEKEGDAAKAKTTFGEMVVRVGWMPANVAAYDAFLMTLVRGEQVEEAVKFLIVMKKNSCLPGLRFFSSALDILVKRKDSKNAILIWDVVVGNGNGLVPNLSIYNAMIGLLCDCNEVDDAFRLLDEMVFHGAFPDSFTYNVIFKCLIKNKKVGDAGKFFVEMVKNEWLPTHANFAAAITMFFEGDDPEMGVQIWNFMVENKVEPLDAAANALLLGLCKLDRLSELKRNADDMLDRRISIHESTMAHLKSAYYKDGRGARDKYDGLARRWKTSLGR
ncbi:PREDICTED: pentatricopeptide repeat-containing protein At1g52640, mitochondrial-like [Prunus mume]|uniref:Pentatricopeptide repeat-containing protein At1g52640, mitochondrial-like n=1 Tax=Prunus mume TaxID=102107 RepID=A0ABM0PDE4_PRUMU|nr:PREDICTED: pentatricopeptide repeat-containing protein At1g52640, mitochondrial-like [Prunus mume]